MKAIIILDIQSSPSYVEQYIAHIQNLNSLKIVGGVTIDQMYELFNEKHSGDEEVLTAVHDFCSFQCQNPEVNGDTVICEVESELEVNYINYDIIDVEKIDVEAS